MGTEMHADACPACPPGDAPAAFPADEPEQVNGGTLASAFAGFTQAQRDKAAELIRDGGLVPTSRPGVYRTVSSKGDVTYLTHSAACNCAGGLHGRLCYHVAAARALQAAATTRKAA